MKTWGCLMHSLLCFFFSSSALSSLSFCPRSQSVSALFLFVVCVFFSLLCLPTVFVFWRWRRSWGTLAFCSFPLFLSRFFSLIVPFSLYWFFSCSPSFRSWCFCFSLPSLFSLSCASPRPLCFFTRFLLFCPLVFLFVPHILWPFSGFYKARELHTSMPQ